MSDPALKTIEHLRMERTTTKRAFSRLANSLVRNHEDMAEEDLKEALSKLTMAAEKVLGVNEDLEAKLLADIEAGLEAGEEAMLSEQQKADLTKTSSDCETKLKTIKNLVQDTLWSSHGALEVLTALQVAESACRNTTAVDLSNKQEAYEFMLTHLQTLARSAKEAHNRWKKWIPSGQKKDLQDRLQELELTVPKLILRKADFILFLALVEV